MLISKEELRFDFQGAEFDLNSIQDKKLLGWIFNQFLYGEVTGIQCGHWLYRAPTLNAASFIAKQASEELSHVRKILRIFTLLGETPAKAHWSIQFLSTGMMGSSWGEHVTLEMALGEGLVLGAFYALEDTIGDPEIKKIINSAAVEEERHVEFGERESQKWLQDHPETRSYMLGLALIQSWVLSHLKRFIVRRVIREFGENHSVLRYFEAFYEHSMKCFEMRIERLGLSPVPVRSLTLIQKSQCVGSLPFRLIQEKLSFKHPLLTSSYLEDPTVLKEVEKFGLSQPKPESDH